MDLSHQDAAAAALLPMTATTDPGSDGCVAAVDVDDPAG
jgi:hypothetical protein